MFKAFREEVPKVAGFYVFRYKDGREIEVWADSPEHHCGNVYSYPVSMYNYRDKDGCCDMGMYVWVNSYTVYECPVEWREMIYSEARNFHLKLYRFSRPSWAHLKGKVSKLP